MFRARFWLEKASKSPLEETVSKIKHIQRLVCDHEVSAIFDAEKLTEARGKLFVATNNLVGAFRAEKVHVSICEGNWKIYVWISKSVLGIHRVPHEKGELQWHDFNCLKDTQASEHVHLVVNDGLRLGL